MFTSLKFFNYRLVFAYSTLMSVAGWGHAVSIDWLVLDLTHSSAALGKMVGIQLAPYIFISLVGGAIADRFNKRNFLMLVCAINTGFALTLFYLYHTGHLTYNLLALIVVLHGTVNAMESPVRNALSLEVVHEENMANAMGLNSMTFNIGRLVGTLIAGFLIARFDNGAPWLAFSVMSVLILVLLSRLRIDEISIAQFGKAKPGKMIDAVRFIQKKPIIFFSMSLAAIFFGLGMHFGQTSSLMVKNIFLKDASYLGFIGIAVAGGSVIGSALASRWSVPGHDPQLSTLLKSGILVAIFWMASSFAPNFGLYATLAGIASIFHLTFMVTSNGLVAASAPEDFRGRIYGIYLCIFYIGSCAGGLLVGALAQSLGVREAIFFGGAVTFLISVISLIWLRSRSKTISR
ncbi:MAG: MFS transporter [Actinomycetes bacterium]|jgi:MFS family permease